MAKIPIIGPTGLPLISADGLPMVCETSNCTCVDKLNPCAACSCFNEEETITLESSGAPIRWVSACDNPRQGDPGLLAGSIELRPLYPRDVANWCGGCLEASPCGGGNSSGGPPDSSSTVPFSVAGHCVFDGVVWNMQQQAGWLVTHNAPARTVDVFFAFWTFVCGGVANRARVWSYIRYHYEYDEDDCDDIINPTFISSHFWSAYSSPISGGPGTVFCSPNTCEGTGEVTASAIQACAIAETESSVSDDAFMGTPCFFFYDDDPDEALSRIPIPAEADRWGVASASPPRIEIRSCNIYPCCDTEGGPPTASMTYEVDGCYIRATDTSTPGTCGPIVRRRWTLQSWNSNPGPSGNSCPDNQRVDEEEGETLDDNEMTYLRAALGCGGKYFRLVLTVWDAAGCRDDVASEIATCCNCDDTAGEPCADPPGSLNVTLIDPETCTYQLAASAPSEGYVPVCGTGTLIIEYIVANSSTGCEAALQRCLCEDFAAGECEDFLTCIGSLGDGGTTTRVLIGHTTIFWRVREATCGCTGPWNEIEINCSPCECCDGEEGAIESATITIGGIVDGDGVVCSDCNSLNDAYIVPSTEDCAGEDEFATDATCNPGQEVSSILIRWEILCDDPDSVTLVVTVSLGGGVPSATFQETVLRPGPDEPIDCTALGSALVLTGCTCGGSAAFRCDASGMTASLAFYVAA